MLEAVIGLKLKSNLSDKFLNTHAELLVAEQQHLNDEETDLSIVTLDTPQ